MLLSCAQASHLTAPGVFNSSPDGASRRTDVILDGSFSILYAVCLAAVIGIATRNFLRFPRMVNKENIFVVVLLALTLFSK